MKKFTYLLIAAMFFAVGVNAQILTEEFNADPVEAGWTLIDNDGDGYNWYHLYEAGEPLLFGYDGNPGIMTSASYAGFPLYPDNWIVTPELENATKVTYYVNAQDANWAQETYALMASTTGTAVADFTVVFEETLSAKDQGTWFERTQELPEGTKYVAWRHYDSSDWFRMNLDGVSIEGANSINELQAQGITVIAGKGMITINSPEAATAQIYNVTGQLVNTVSLSKTQTTVQLSAGVYLVRVGKAVQKVLVK